MAVNESFVFGGLEFNDGVNYRLESLDVRPPKKKPLWITGAESDGGELVEEARFENRVVTGRVVVVQRATQDLALAALGALTDVFQEVERGGQDAEWTPAGSTLTLTLNVLLAEMDEVPITVETRAGRQPVVDFTLTCRPFMLGAPMATITDAFATNTIADYTFDQGSGTLSVSGGQLVPSDAAPKRIFYSAAPHRFTDSWVTWKFTTGASVASYEVFIQLKRLAAGDYLMAGLTSGGTVLAIYTVDGGSATYKVGASRTLSPATSYWLRGRLEGNIVTVELWTAAPTVTGTPATTTTYTLTGADATKFGAGVRGNVGLRLGSPADWRYDDFAVEPHKTKSTEPLVVLEVAGVPGDVRAIGTLVVEDAAGQHRRYARWGREAQNYNPALGLLLDAPSQTSTTGLSGVTGTRAGAYSGGSNNVVTVTLQPQVQSVLSTGAQSHIGTFRVFARIYFSAVTAAVRLTWQQGDGPERSNAYVQPAVVGWNDVDLGVITVTPATMGAQKWRGVIDAYSTTTGGEVMDVDVLSLMPADEGLGIARASYSYRPGVLTAHDAFTGMTSGTALNARVAPLGGTWATSGAATDFTAYDGPAPAETMLRATESDTGRGRFAVLGATNYTDSEVQVAVHMARAGTPVYQHQKQGCVARWVNASNHLEVLVSAGELRVEAVIADVPWQRANVAFAHLPDTWYRVRVVVYASGIGYAYVLGVSGNIIKAVQFSDVALATGGALASGKPGIVDCRTAAGFVGRQYDDFHAATPAPEPIVIYSGRTIRFAADKTERADAAGTYYGQPPSYVGSRFALSPDGGVGRRNRVAVSARRNDITVTNDDNIADAVTVQATYTPRYLVAPRD